jgi:hypothetical protein
MLIIGVGATSRIGIIIVPEATAGAVDITSCKAAEGRGWSLHESQGRQWVAFEWLFHGWVRPEEDSGGR